MTTLARLAKTRNRIDSGNAAYCTGSRISGNSPPTYHTERQPKCGINPAARPPAAAAPSEKPVNMIITSVARRRSGQYSAVSAMAFGIAPPSPRPVIKRKMRSCVSFVDVAVTMVKTPNIAVQISTTQRRPILSATGPNRSAPINRANQAGYKDGSERFARKLPLSRNRRRDECDRLGIETIEENRQSAKRNDKQLKSAYFAFIDERRNVDCRCCHFRPYELPKISLIESLSHMVLLPMRPQRRQRL